MRHNRLRTTVALVALAWLPAAVRADAPPPDTHSDDILLGHSMGYGTTGSGSGLWFLDAAQNPDRLAQWFAGPHTMTPNIDGPADAGHVYFNLGSNVVTAYDAAQNKSLAVLSSATLQAVSVAPGLQVFKGQYRFFAADPATTVLNDTFAYPYLGTFHNHFSCRVFRPGTYQFSFKLTHVTARDGTSLSDSPVYTLTLRSRAALTARALLPGWERVDDTPERTGNLVRVFVFPANSSPSQEADALTTTDVYLDASGTFQVPEGLVPDGSYRIGLKPLTAPGLARLMPGNVALSASAPTDLTGRPVTLPLGDANRDGAIDGLDLNAVSQSYDRPVGSPGYRADADVNGDGYVDGLDANVAAQSYDQYADFFP